MAVEQRGNPPAVELVRDGRELVGPAWRYLPTLELAASSPATGSRRCLAGAAWGLCIGRTTWRLIALSL